MKMRGVLLLLLIMLSLIMGADRLPDSCKDAWAPDLNTSTFPQGVGVNIHFTDPRPGEVKMIADAGFRWVRMDFIWELTEKERGRYDFAPYERLLAELEPHGIRALFILDYGNRLYTEDKAVRTEEARQAYARWAVAAAKHFANRGVIWECFNEPNVPLFWPPKPNVDEYVALALMVGRSFRASVPNERLIGPATLGLDFNFLEACFKAGLLEYWSAVSVHPYRQSNPENAANEYCVLREMIERYKPKGAAARTIPIISGEWGYSSAWQNMSEGKQAQLVSRALLTNRANGIPISIWYDWQDDGTDASEAEHHFGLIRYAHESERQPGYQPKPSYLASRTLNQFVTGYTFRKRLPVGNDSDYVLLFANDNNQRIAVWTTDSQSHRVTVPLAAASYALTRHTGEDAGVVAANQDGITLEVSPSPIYLTRRP
ncbi:MAG TPA: cellulase family glycosylhydrolase [Pyrinomonadaceae bacterium]|nr:cellulase family glycosylhydrolase [Pyrinomonadaceae bacterium]